MLDLIGKSYIIDCCIAEINKARRRECYEIYISDVAAALINMFAKDAHYPRYYDLMHPETQDKRTGEEIAEDIINKFGLTVGE